MVILNDLQPRFVCSKNHQRSFHIAVEGRRDRVTPVTLVKSVLLSQKTTVSGNTLEVSYMSSRILITCESISIEY